MRILGLIASTLVFAWVLAGSASAVPVSVTHSNLAGPCDPLSVPDNVHELGLGPSSGGPFPTNEEIAASDIPISGDLACVMSFANPLVTMTNLTGTDWEDVWYVADPETTILNFDGLVSSVPYAAATGAARFPQHRLRGLQGEERV